MIPAQAILSYDSSGRVLRVSRIWPAFSDEVVNCFRRIWQSDEVHKERFVRRAEDFVNRDRANRISAEFMGWELEVFETAFQEALRGLSAHLQAELSDTDERQILLDTLPAFDLPLCRELNRVARPDLPRPSRTTPRFEPITALTGLSEYTGWYRLGAWEDEWITASSRESTGSYSTAIRGVVAVPERSRAALSEPLRLIEEAGLADLSHPLPTPGKVQQLSGPIVIGCRLRNLLGHGPLLLPTPELATLCSLSRDKCLLPLTYRRPEGTPWLRFRAWRAEPIRVGDEGTAYQLAGCDLVAHPDMVRFVQTSLAGHLIEEVDCL